MIERVDTRGTGTPGGSGAGLGNVALFRGLDACALARIKGEAHEQAVEAGGAFFREGEKADAFFVLARGRVKLTQLTPEGHQVVLRIIGAGDAFGGAGAFGDATYPIGAEAVESAAALRWTSAVIRRLMETEPHVALNAVKFVAARYHDLQRRHRQLMTERVERRVARALLRLASQAGRRVDAGVEIDFAISRQDIAEMTGTTLYTVSRLVSAWEEQGIVHTARQRITIRKPRALMSLGDDMPE
jgi:CRP-like cAMP-binding protein